MKILFLFPNLLFLSMLLFAITAPVTHWYLSAFVGLLLLLIVVYLTRGSSKQYKDNLFFKLNMLFVVVFFLYTPYVMIANRYAVKYAMHQIEDLQKHVCSGQELNMKHWEHKSEHSYQFSYRLLGQQYRITCIVQNDKKKFSAGTFRTYDQIAPYIEGGPDKCNNIKIKS